MKQAAADKCPYLSLLRDQQCMLTRGGLYVPLPDHVHMVCSTAAHVSCQHYVMGCKMMLAEVGAGMGFRESGRRRHPRFATEYSAFIRLREDGNRHAGVEDVEEEDSEALVLDFSQGGLRAETSRALPVGQRVFFDVDSRYFNGAMRGCSGKVRWCQPDQQTGGFQVGLLFDDPRTEQVAQQAVRRFL